MTVVGARIDNRLLHGIVATSWAPRSNANRVMVIDDEVADNPVEKQAMRLGRPTGMATSIISRRVALENFKKHKYDRQRVFIVSKTPEVFLDLINSGVKISELILGGTLTYEGAIKVTNRAYIKKEQLSVYQQILDKECTIISQYVPNDKKIDVSKFIKRSE
ncbi:MAG: PTS sugar transporter subunit IIB [Liquorilactobacillus ghanensis]|uniref:PTS EIIB type-4 domain-containing protein n=1 Tax=Liquorilactobacillus ghanensis DSM 18630 TaxID=1423750 RepID=A0A0R1VKX8_9LACO|nr:PTS sugar transporter subunit IIB [Liquorilactobacillus ghanensis]KRM04004.1 hypothetical protein FC89_GL002407 [Liquorilactobacillus ghanensis DSM 18630]